MTKISNRLLAFLFLFLSPCAHALAPEFGNLPRSNDAKSITLAHEKSYFPNGPSKRDDSVMGLPEVLIKPNPSLIADSHFKKLSPTEAIQTVVLHNGDNITVIHSGWEYKAVTIRVVTKEDIAGATDLAKAASVIPLLQKLALEGPFDLEAVAKTFSKMPSSSPHNGSTSIIGFENDMLHPQVTLIRADDHVIEFRMVEGPV